MGACDTEDNFPLEDPATLRMRLISDGLSLDMMIVEREGQRAVTVRVCSSHDKLSALTAMIFTLKVCLTRIDNLPSNIDYNEGFVDVCQRRALFVVVLSRLSKDKLVT